MTASKGFKSIYEEIEMMTEEQLELKLAQIRGNCEGWRKCQDGSYEMALDANGFGVVLNKLRSLRGEQ